MTGSAGSATACSPSLPPCWSCSCAPRHPERASLLAGLLAEWTQLVAYAGAFLAIGASWLGHRSIVRAPHRDINSVHVANLILLMVVAFVPFPAELVAATRSSPASERQAAALLSASLAAVSCAMLALDYLGSTRRNRIRGTLLTPDRFGPLLYAAGTIICLVSAPAGLLADLAISIGYLLLPARTAPSHRRIPSGARPAPPGQAHDSVHAIPASGDEPAE